MAVDRHPVDEVDVAVGALAAAARLALLPFRVVARTPLGPALAEAGRQAEAGATRGLDHAVAGPVPDAINRALASGDLDARMALALRQVIESPEVRSMLREETRGVADETVAAVRDAAVRWDGRLDRRPAPGRELYGGVATRGLALVVDLALAQTALAVAGGLLALLTSIVGELRPAWAVALAVSLAWAVFVVAYFVLFWSTAGQTPGMRLLHLRVVGPDARPPGALRSLARLVGLALAIVPLFLGFLPALYDGRRRALPDYVAGTVVVRS